MKVTLKYFVFHLQIQILEKWRNLGKV